MMAVVYLPSLLRDLTDGEDQVRVPGTTLRQVMTGLEERFPGIRSRLCDENGIRPNIAVWLDGEHRREGMYLPVEEESEIHFLPAVSGGSSNMIDARL